MNSLQHITIGKQFFYPPPFPLATMDTMVYLSSRDPGHAVHAKGGQLLLGQGVDNIGILERVVLIIIYSILELIQRSHGKEQHQYADPG